MGLMVVGKQKISTTINRMVYLAVSKGVGGLLMDLPSVVDEVTVGFVRLVFVLVLVDVCLFIDECTCLAGLVLFALVIVLVLEVVLWRWHEGTCRSSTWLTHLLGSVVQKAASFSFVGSIGKSFA